VHNFDALRRQKSGELPMETSRAVVRGRRERNAWLIVTQSILSPGVEQQSLHSLVV
jgi:hypothetical protein